MILSTQHVLKKYVCAQLERKEIYPDDAVHGPTGVGSVPIELADYKYAYRSVSNSRRSERSSQRPGSFWSTLDPSELKGLVKNLSQLNNFFEEQYEHDNTISRSTYQFSQDAKVGHEQAQIQHHEKLYELLSSRSCRDRSHHALIRVPDLSTLNNTGPAFDVHLSVCSETDHWHETRFEFGVCVSHQEHLSTWAI